MLKYAVMVGQTDKGEFRVIGAPTDKPEALIDDLRKITNDGGAVKDGKSTVQYTEASILHSSKGRMKTRKFDPKPAPKASKPKG